MVVSFFCSLSLSLLILFILQMNSSQTFLYSFNRFKCHSLAAFSFCSFVLSYHPLVSFFFSLYFVGERGRGKKNESYGFISMNMCDIYRMTKHLSFFLNKQSHATRFVDKQTKQRLMELFTMHMYFMSFLVLFSFTLSY